MEYGTFVNILRDTLNIKNSVLEQLLEVTRIQENALSVSPPNMEEFEQVFQKKEVLIEQLGKLDDGFERIYEHVREELANNPNLHQEEILELQKLIREITEKSTEIQSLEIQNRNKVEAYFNGQRKEIKQFKINRRTASSYYKNMADQHYGESYFYDKKN